jgi:hypothetical protein
LCHDYHAQPQSQNKTSAECATSTSRIEHAAHQMSAPAPKTLAEKVKAAKERKAAAAAKSK